MDLEALYGFGVTAVLVAAGGVFIALLFVTAPYGRHARGGYGPGLPARWAWFVMELPSPACFLYAYLQGDHAGAPLPLLFLGLYQVHYLQRTFLFPLLMRQTDKPQPLTTVALAIVFNTVNGLLNGFAVSHVAARGSEWLLDPRFGLGIALFVVGYGVNQHSDAVLRALRRPGETGYKIPKRGLFRFVSSANYFGELVEWTGWAIATWSGAGLAFAVFTAANLVPRALDHHRWYREQFPDYPPERRAILPGLL
ncbi:MAG: DUF1295 domain-containing protein [Proteobacteria bacterium]|nr:DUF1295 domain-containing protein [Pseudomonadota bacterium]